MMVSISFKNKHIHPTYYLNLEEEYTAVTVDQLTNYWCPISYSTANNYMVLQVSYSSSFYNTNKKSNDR